MAILVAGGAGYIGSHTCVELLNAGYDVIVVDNLSNSCEESIRRVEKITGKKVRFYLLDLLDSAGLEGVFSENEISAVINFAGLKSVCESVSLPLEYYWNNIAGMLTLLKVMRRHDVKRLIFSSSATVYGDAREIPITEACPKGRITNPYGQTKAMLEQILTDLYASDASWRIMLLRYFNPVGAHESGLIGENPRGVPNNLVPYIAQVAAGKRAKLLIFGNDYPTHDGTGVRDYIHVVDLAIGHIRALQKIEKDSCGSLSIYNLGTGRGYSVLDVVHAYEQVCGRPIPYEIRSRRPGDVAVSYCDASKAFAELGWKAQRDIRQMCADSWRWQSMNPDGYPQDGGAPIELHPQE